MQLVKSTEHACGCISLVNHGIAREGSAALSSAYPYQLFQMVLPWVSIDGCGL
jgi:hypothetical protein